MLMFGLHALGASAAPTLKATRVTFESGDGAVVVQTAVVTGLLATGEVE
jgi:hypothetical protein